MTKNKDLNLLLREEMIREMLRYYQSPGPFQVSGSSIFSSTGVSSSSSTVQGAAGGASGAATTPLTTMVWSSGTAGSATSSTPPDWAFMPWSTHKDYKYHLLEPGSIDSLCGIEANWTYNGTTPPPTKRHCKKCVSVFKKNVMEGRYAR